MVLLCSVVPALILGCGVYVRVGICACTRPSGQRPETQIKQPLRTPGYLHTSNQELGGGLAVAPLYAPTQVGALLAHSAVPLCCCAPTERADRPIAAHWPRCFSQLMSAPSVRPGNRNDSQAPGVFSNDPQGGLASWRTLPKQDCVHTGPPRI